ncbi:MAG TPA: hypothetical protein VJT78_12660 [Candidatus Dormibacteraeota bacterium]|nr:hypothetical protein [Candidatus Dormibacteraeota bacterium]
MASADLTRWAGYILALVIGAAAVIWGLVSAHGVITGAGAGWLIASVILIVRQQSAHVKVGGAAGLSVFAIFGNLSPLLWGVSVALVVVGGLVGFLIKH